MPSWKDDTASSSVRKGLPEIIDVDGVNLPARDEIEEKRAEKRRSNIYVLLR
jgi:hypothetical protein